ncbi:sensor domain-containing diguanylate cyclase [Roseateles sp. DAIF2]|uniref:sensor domain-containing diguanylate cyclase n=1 Tax=Roseateles sp. DAIF2 TaxID=2714952 RepID=UPI0018A2CC14|nr:sensor domain-containing diguanylate cyclase [Roseateles sp. DAIF2]QPF73813.1 sensor domain-containing diguanylate cyclase [Roseateles sp. DAIF2]
MDPILAQLSSTLPAARSLEQLTRPLLEMLRVATGLESTYLTEIDLAADRQQVRYARNAGAMTIPEGLSVPWGDTLCKRALDEGRMATSDVVDCWGDSEAARALGIQTYVSAPVRGGEGQLLGTLCAASADRRQIGDEAAAMLQLFSGLVAGFIERERLVEHLQAANARLLSYAMRDTLTGLPNRRALYDELQRLLAQAQRDGRSVLVGMVDLDGFKAINDRHGHQSGDLFLQQAGQRLTASLRAGDMLGRLGGDEFLLVGPGPALPTDNGGGPVVEAGEAPQAALTLQQRCTEATLGRYRLDTAELDYAGASVGVLALDPAGLTVEDAVRLADACMYRVKHQRRQRASAAPA